MSDQNRRPRGFDPAAQMRARHDEFVNAQAVRLGVKPSAILAAVRNRGLTAQEIESARDCRALEAPTLNVIETRPVMRTIDTKRVAKRRVAKVAAGRVVPRRSPAAQKRRDRERMGKWLGDGSMADALRKVGLRK